MSPVGAITAPLRVAVLDDYQNVALTIADWSMLKPQCEIVSFQDVIADPHELTVRLRDFDIVVAMRERTRFSAETLSGLSRLKCLVTTGPANAAIDVGAANRLGIQVSGTDSVGQPTVELTWGLMLSLLRSIPYEDRAMREGRWQSTIGRGIEGKCIGIVGLGRIGRNVASVAKAFGMHVIAWTPSLTPERASKAGCESVSFDELLARADVVSIHAKLTPSNRGLFGADQFKAMKSTAVLVNTARGPLVDEQALVEALTNGTIAGFAGDVYAEEPLPPDHPLRSAPRTVLTPHLGYVTEETYRMFYSQVVENIAAFIAGNPIRTVAAA